VAQGEAASEKWFVEEIVRRLEERGVGVNDLLLSALSKEDRRGSVRLRLGLAEAEECVRKRDAVQASEKDYRAPPRRSLRPWPRGLACLSTDMRLLRRPVGRSWAASGLTC
jgi:hypothetical protein